jgi:hypothetical protein
MSRVGAPSFLEISRESWVVLPRPQPAMVGPTAGLNEVALASKAPRCAPSSCSLASGAGASDRLAEAAQVVFACGRH